MTRTLADVLRWRAECQPDRLAFRFLHDPADSADEITYAELDRCARVIAARLSAHGPAGERALLVYSPGLEFIAALFGCWYAGWIAVPATPPTLSERRARLDGIIQNARPRVALTLNQQTGRVEGSSADLAWVATEGAPSGDDGSGGHPYVAMLDDVALLQYTSGSTAAPRGVVLSHANLVHNTRHIGRRFGMHAGSRGVNWLPPYHDMGLIGAILQCVAVGCRGALLSPLAFLRRPARWLEAISCERGTISGGPNFAYELCLQRVTAAERAKLDLSSWEVAFVGAEPVRSATLERFAATFAECGFRREALYPCYGLAEATLMVSGGERLGGFHTRTHAGRSVVSCGRVADDEVLRIHDPETGETCADGQVGEIGVSGPSVARAYWGGERFEGTLHTGDLGFLEDGELYVTGRIKALLIVNGRKLHAEDVERTVVESHPGGWPGGVAALAIDTGDREQLVICQELDRRADASHADVMHAVKLAVAEQHQVAVAEVVLLRPGQIPRTSSGKVRRDACREAYRSGQWVPR